MSVYVDAYRQLPYRTRLVLATVPVTLSRQINGVVGVRVLVQNDLMPIVHSQLF